MNSTSPTWRNPMIIGLGIFAFIAILLIVAFVKVKKADRKYGEGE